jgi:hypothetical protein
MRSKMGHTYKQHRVLFDDDYIPKKQIKSPKHSNNHKTGGLKVINRYGEEDLDESESTELIPSKH